MERTAAEPYALKRCESNECLPNELSVSHEFERSNTSVGDDDDNIPVRTIQRNMKRTQYPIIQFGYIIW